MPSRVSFPFTTFNDPSGNPLSNGKVLIALGNDGQAPDGLICRGMTLQVKLDANGIMTSVPEVWPNDDILPGGTYYVMNGYTSNGELVTGPTKVTV